MKSFWFTRKKFNEEPTTTESIEVWCVKWYSIYHDIGRFYNPKTEIMAFTSKSEAENHANELIMARKLLGDNVNNPVVYKQEAHTNCDEL